MRTPPISTRTYTLFPYTTLFRSVLDQPARDRDLRRQQQAALGRGAAQRGVDFVEGEPARVLKLVAYLRLVRPGLGEEAEHQRRRERPWLRREVAAAQDAHAAFLQHLALDGLLQRFARLDEAGQGGVAVRRPAGLPPGQQAAAGGDGDE